MFLFRRLSRAAALAVALPVAALPLCAQTPPMTPDIPAHVEQPQTGFNYTKRVVMVPMRDGVKLYTVILVPKGAKNLPMVLTRTPYDAAGLAPSVKIRRTCATRCPWATTSSRTATTSACGRTSAASTGQRATT